jgi:hypothetical protein
MGIDLGSDGKTLCNHLHACPPDRFEKACKVCPPTGRVKGKRAGMGEKGFRIGKEMAAFVHHLDRTADLCNPVQRHRERFVKEAEGGDAQHVRRECRNTGA